MGHSKKNICRDIGKGSKVSVTLTFRRVERFESQIISSALFIKRYARAYDKFHLAPELGNGRLHWHFCGEVKSLLKHKIFMHNWNYKYGNTHIDTWDGGPSFIAYIQKEHLLQDLLPNLYDEIDLLYDCSSIQQFVTRFKEKYLVFKDTYEVNGEYTACYVVRDITEYKFDAEA